MVLIDGFFYGTKSSFNSIQIPQHKFIQLPTSHGKCKMYSLLKKERNMDRFISKLIDTK